VADGGRSTNGGQRLGLSSVLGKVTVPAGAQLLLQAEEVIRRIWPDVAFDQSAERFRLLLDDLLDSETECSQLRQRLQSLEFDKANLEVACRQLEAACLHARQATEQAIQRHETVLADSERALRAEREREDSVAATHAEAAAAAARAIDLHAKAEAEAADAASLRVEIQRLQRENTLLLTHLGRLSLGRRSVLPHPLLPARSLDLPVRATRAFVGRVTRRIAVLRSTDVYVMRASGERARITPNALEGFLEQAEVQQGVTRLTGWAIDVQGHDPSEIVLLAGNVALAAGIPSLARPDVGEAKGLGRIPIAGFVLSFDRSLIDGIPRDELRLCAVSRDGLASELVQLCTLS
jgi:hypothetical protein